MPIRDNFTKFKGFTLIEVLIVMVIAGILASVGLPAYKTYLIEQRRSDAVQALQEAQLRITEYLLYNDTLPNVGSESEVMEALKIDSQSNGTYYNVSIPMTSYSGLKNEYKVIATPIGKQAQDTECPEIWVSEVYTIPNPKTCR